MKNMNFRLAKEKDLPELKEVYNKIIENMHKNNITIWNEYYPYEEFIEDIKKESLYLLVNEGEIVAAFALHESISNEEKLEWSDKEETAMYINRIGVNINYLRQGIGSKILNKAKEIAKDKNKYLRLLVIENNKPAIQLYIKEGFKKVDGIYELDISNNKKLIEYGFEIK